MTPHELAAKAVPGEKEVIETIALSMASAHPNWEKFLDGPKKYRLRLCRANAKNIYPAIRPIIATLQAQIATARDDALRFAADNPPELTRTSGGVMGELGWSAAIGAYQKMLRSLITTPAPAPAPKLEDNKTISEFVNRQQRLGPEFEKAIFDNIEELYESDGTPAPEKE